MESVVSDYTDILIRVFPYNSAGRFYPTEAAFKDGTFFGKGRLELERERLLSVYPEPKEYGEMLFAALFNGPLLTAYDKSRGAADAETQGRLRVRLWIDEGAADLHEIPWERIYQQAVGVSVPLACSGSTPFSRYFGLEFQRPAPLARLPLRLLVVAANPLRRPHDLPRIAMEDEIPALWEALAPFRGRIAVTFILGKDPAGANLRTTLAGPRVQVLEGPASLENIARNLPGHDVLHLLCHGLYRRQAPDGPGVPGLLLEADSGEASIVSGEEFASTIASGERKPHLVFLSACESAKSDGAHVFAGLGPSLVQAGVPAVVAMQDRVPVTLARQLSRDFYENLFRHGRVDVALNQARRLLFEDGSIDWAIPVLFSRLEQNRLAEFHLKARLRRNLALVLLLVPVLAFWFYRHLYDLNLPALAVTGSLALLLAAMNWLLGDRMRSAVKRHLKHPVTTAALVAGLALAAVMLLFTSSISVRLDEGALANWREFRVEILEADQPFLELPALTPRQPLFGWIRYGRLHRTHLTFRVTTPPVFEAVERDLRPWTALRLDVPTDFKRIEVIHVVPGVFLSSDFPANENSSRSFSLRIKVNGEIKREISSLREGQNFYLGADGKVLEWIRSQSETPAFLRAYLDGVPRLSAGQKETWYQLWQRNAEGVSLRLDDGDDLELEFLDDNESRVVARKTILIGEDNEEFTSVVVAKAEGL